MPKLNREKFANCVNDLKDYASIVSIAGTYNDIHTLEASRPKEEGEKPVDKTKPRTHNLEAIDRYKKAIGIFSGQIQTQRK